LRDKLITEMKKYFGKDRTRIEHALKVLSYAERIAEKVKADQLTITGAAILHDIGIPESERKYNSSSGKYQEIEGPPIAERIMNKLNISRERINHICKIIANHHSGENIDTPEFRILWDSDWIVNIEEEGLAGKKSKKELHNFIDRIFRTDTGKKIAREGF